MTRTTLLALASRVEAATGADRELDIDIALATIPHLFRSEYGGVVYDNEAVCRKHDPNHRRYIYDTPRYTASLDAAMSLVPSGYAMGFKRAPCQRSHAMLATIGEEYNASGATTALAMTAVCLRAIAGSME